LRISKKLVPVLPPVVSIVVPAHSLVAFHAPGFAVVKPSNLLSVFIVNLLLLFGSAKQSPEGVTNYNRAKLIWARREWYAFLGQIAREKCSQRIRQTKYQLTTHETPSRSIAAPELLT